MSFQIDIKKQQIEIAFDGINQKFITALLKDIADAGKKKLRNNSLRSNALICLFYKEVQIDTFNAICERFNEVPEYKGYCNNWQVTISIDKNEEDIYSNIAVYMESEKQVLAYSYSNSQQLKR